MQKFLKWLRDWGLIGSWIAKLIQWLLVLYPALTLSAIVASLVAWWHELLLWVQQPNVFVPAMVFVFVLWTYIGLAVSRRVYQVQTVRVAHDYVYSIVPESGWSVVVGKLPSRKIGGEETDGLSLAFQFRNVAAGPMWVRLVGFDVVVDERTTEEPFNAIEMTLPRLGQRIIRSPGIRRDAEKKQMSGRAKIQIAYGPPDSPPVRLYSLEVKLQIAFTPDGALAMLQDNIVSESDSAYE